MEWVKPDKNYYGCWDKDKKPNDGRLFWHSPYRYVLDNGDVQETKATICVKRRAWYRKCFPFIRKTRQYIDVEFHDEVGSGTGSWKGGTIGCSYEMKKDEHPLTCLRRMETERRFR
jgi:hypothetical protein